MRSVTIIATQADDATVQKVVSEYLTSQGFKFKNYKGQMVWKKGNGWLTAPRCINVFRKDGYLYFESWILFALLPGVYLSEMPLTGFWGFAIKEALKSVVRQLTGMLIAPGTVPQGTLQL